MRPDIEHATFSAFVSPPRRHRYLSLLETKRGRNSLRALLAHGGDLDERFYREIPASIASISDLVSLLKRSGAPQTCYVISESNDLDGLELDLATALEKVSSIGQGSLISCIPGTLAFYQGEMADERLLLYRRPI